jgi:iron-sulfur cluster assembly accessory protein
MSPQGTQQQFFRRALIVLCVTLPLVSSWIVAPKASFHQVAVGGTHRTTQGSSLFSTATPAPPTPPTVDDIEYESPEDAVVLIKPAAMKHLVTLRAQQKLAEDEPLVLRMGVRSGGCSGMSYVMDFSTPEDIAEDDAVDEYAAQGIKCVVDAKSMLYLYGLELDYSPMLIGGGFQFYNPNAEESCGCGSSFGV